jgi:D-alanyl-D-alanine carboxypeptidase
VSPSAVVRSVEAFGAAWGVPGGVVTITEPGGPTSVLPFGLADRERGIRAAAHHRFEIGSISKVVTALTVLGLVDDGLLTLDTEAGDILPWLPAALRAPGVTVRRLLQHTAGLPASIDALQDETAQLASAVAPPPEPGRTFHYSNVGFLVLGRIATALTGTPLPELVAAKVLGPAGMTDSLADVRFDDRALLATGYRPARSDRPWVPGDAIEPAAFLEVAGADGNVAATGADLAALARLLLRRAEGVVSASAFAAMTGELAPGGEPVVPLPGVPTTTSSRYGLGVNVERVDDRTVLTHGGGMVGYASFLLADLDAGRSVTVLTNAHGDSPVAEVITRAVAAGAPGTLDVLRSERWRADPDGAPGSTGSAPQGRFGDLLIAAAGQEDAIALTAELHGTTAPLLWGWGDRVTSRHPSLRRFGLVLDEGRWTSGPRIFDTELQQDPALAARCGRYRSYSPWLPELQVVQRSGALRLLAWNAVEAPGEDLPLLLAHDGTAVIGDDRLSPERLSFGPVVDGECVWIDKGGCRFSRAFTD